MKMLKILLELQRKILIFFTTSSHETAREWESLLYKRNWNYNKSIKKLFVSSSEKMVQINVQVGNFKLYKLKCECSCITVPSSSPLYDQSKKKTFHSTEFLYYL